MDGRLVVGNLRNACLHCVALDGKEMTAPKFEAFDWSGCSCTIEEIPAGGAFALWVATTGDRRIIDRPPPKQAGGPAVQGELGL